MHFSRLKLVGFKSFVESSELLIDEGLTGVVGPNGCGKSNLLEALRWVMGETSYKNMRGSGMDDVIFAGTDNRPSRNVAEVVLTLDNSARTAPAAFNDSDIIEISRRIERDKGSGYKINSMPVRAKDVQLLFADASTGSRSPALVQQGRIGEIVNSKPQNRRVILEEAAGISGLYSRRHEAELRLKNTEINLERLADIQGQLSTQLGSLKRQARQARQYKNISQQIRQNEAALLYLRWQNAHHKVEKAEQAYQLALQLVGEHTQAEARLRILQESQSSALDPLREKEVIAAAVLQRLNIEQNTLRQEEQRQQERKAELEKQHNQLQQDLERENSQTLEAEESITTLEQEKELLDAASDSQKQKSQAEEAVQEAEMMLQGTEERLALLTSDYADKTAQTRQAQTALVAEQSKQETLKNQLDDLQKTLAGLGETEQVEQSIQHQNEIFEQTQDQGEEIAEELRHQDSLVLEYESQRNEKQELLGTARLKAEKLETEISTLENLLMPEKSTEGWQAIINEVSVTPGFEAALAAAFGEELEDPIAEDAPAHWKLILDTAKPISFALDCQLLSEVVKAPKQLSLRLNHTAIIEQDKGSTAQAALLPGQRLVSKQGDLWRWDGYSRSADSQSGAAKRLQERNRLEQLKVLYHERTDALENATELLEDAAIMLEEAKTLKQEISYRLKENSAQGNQARDELASLQQELSQIRQNRASHEATLTSLSEQLKTTRHEISRLLPLCETGRDLEDLQQELDMTRDETEEARHNYAESKALLGALQREHEQRNARFITISTELERWQNRKEAATAHIEELEARFEDVSEELAELETSPEDLMEKQAIFMNKIAQAEQERQQASDALQEAQNQLRNHDKALVQVQNDLGTARETRARAEAQLESSREKRLELSNLIKEKFRCLPEGCLSIAEIKEADELPTLDKIEKDLSQLKSTRERLGSVNLRADIELEELETQFDTMAKDRLDIEQAIAKLRGSIAQLNKEGRARLLEAFEIVNNHFQKLFSTLFNGGTAKLELIESDDPLKAGLEIIARPPGKKPQVLTLLSGGEKALTAMSLIFAVFLTNPSPICVLDEVDAPLDDSNVGRFCNLLDEMNALTDTRFLVITHHPQTMARMNRLFGVTMAEKGVSMLVSVDLEDAERLRDVG